jgi:hypothetical protein
MSILTKTTRALALLAEAEELLTDAMRAERVCGDPEGRDIQDAMNKTYAAREAAQSMFQRDY